uniref:Uncharacterized protein n=1 Tax=Timema bartmani TaxID=61472 RepID=A0A7R9HX67_9NEOP|nr:unnamed protein product [Timema bartmani]
MSPILMAPNKLPPSSQYRTPAASSWSNTWRAVRRKPSRQQGGVHLPSHKYCGISFVTVPKQRGVSRAQPYHSTAPVSRTTFLNPSTGVSNYEVRLTGDWFIPSNVVKLRRPPGNPREHIKTLDKQVKLKRKLELQEYVEAQEASMEHRRAIFKSHCLGLCEAKRNMKVEIKRGLAEILERSATTPAISPLHTYSTYPLGDNRKIQISSDSATSPADTPTCMLTQVSTDVACSHRADRRISSVLNPFVMDLYSAVGVAAAFIIVVRRCLRTGPYPAMFPIGGRETETLGTLFDLLPPDTSAMFPCIRRQGKHRRSACIWRLSSSGNACNMHSPVSKDTTWLKERNSLKAECLHDGGPILFTQSLGELESMMWQIADFVSPAESIVSLDYGGIIQIDPPVMEAAPHCLKPGPYLNQILVCLIQIDPPVMEAAPHCLKPGLYLNHILVSLKPGQHLNQILVCLKPGPYLNQILVCLKPGPYLNQILICIIQIDPPVMEATPHCLKPGPYLNHILVSLKPGQQLNHILVCLKPGPYLNQILICIIQIDPPVMEATPHCLKPVVSRYCVRLRDPTLFALFFTRAPIIVLHDGFAHQGHRQVRNRLSTLQGFHCAPFASLSPSTLGFASVTAG